MNTGSNDRRDSIVAFWGIKHYVNRQQRSDIKSSGIWYYKPQIILSFCSPASLTKKTPNPRKSLPQNELTSWLRIQKEIWAWDISSKKISQSRWPFYTTHFAVKRLTPLDQTLSKQGVFFPEKFSVWQNKIIITLQHFLIWETQFSIKRGLVFFLLSSNRNLRQFFL